MSASIWSEMLSAPARPSSSSTSARRISTSTMLMRSSSCSPHTTYGVTAPSFALMSSITNGSGSFDMMAVSTSPAFDSLEAPAVPPPPPPPESRLTEKKRSAACICSSEICELGWRPKSTGLSAGSFASM